MLDSLTPRQRSAACDLGRRTSSRRGIRSAWVHGRPSRFAAIVTHLVTQGPIPTPTLPGAGRATWNACCLGSSGRHSVWASVMSDPMATRLATRSVPVDLSASSQRSKADGALGVEGMDAVWGHGRTSVLCRRVVSFVECVASQLIAAQISVARPLNSCRVKTSLASTLRTSLPT